MNKVSKIRVINHGSVKSDDKLFHVPFILKYQCECGHEIEDNFSNRRYFDYPDINKPFKHYLYCPGCDENHEVTVLLKMEMVVTQP